MNERRQSSHKREKLLFAAILAAGSASRFGSPKQLAELDGESLVRRATRVAESVTGERTVLCVGASWHQVFDSASPMRGFLIMNDDYRSGMAGSIAATVRALPANADGLLLILADQPRVETADLERLVKRWRQAPEHIVCSCFAGTNGPPAIFPSRVFDDLAAVTGDQGARSVLRRYANSVETIELTAAAIDIDTPEDLAGLKP